MSERKFKLTIYGGENIERTTETFDRLSEAIDEVEMACTDDTDEWDIGEGTLKLVDRNGGRQENLVINKIEQI